MSIVDEYKGDQCTFVTKSKAALRANLNTIQDFVDYAIETSIFSFFPIVGKSQESWLEFFFWFDEKLLLLFRLVMDFDTRIK